MPILVPGAGEAKNRNSGSLQPRVSQELASPTENQRNHFLQLNNAQPAYASKFIAHPTLKSNGSSSTQKDITLQDIIAQDPFEGMKLVSFFFFLI